MKSNLENLQKIPSVKENLQKARRYKNTEQLLQTFKTGGSKRESASHGITRKEFFTILDKASQPIKREAESDSEKSET